MDPYYGFYHKNHSSEQALAYDLAESYRVLIEFSVLEFSRTNRYWNLLHKCFRLDETNHYQIQLDELTIKRFLETISRKFNEKKMFISRFGNRGNVNKKTPTRESTIIKLQIEELTNFCLSNTIMIFRR